MRVKEFFRRYKISNLTGKINAYGFEYSGKKFIFQTLMILLVVFGVCYLSNLHIEYVSLLLIITILSAPFLINAWFSQLYAAKRFVMVSDYLTNIIPIFIQKPKVLNTLEEVLDLTSGHMKKTISKAIDYIHSNTDDPEMLKTALGMIEKEFPNSRIKAANKLMLSVESNSSINHRDVCENLYLDIEAWIKRAYAFQKDLINRRNKLIVLCAMTLALNSLLVYMYNSNEYFYGFTDGLLYQVITTVFIIVILLIIIIILTRLHGEWLIDDMTNKDERLINKSYDYINSDKKKGNLPNIIVSLVMMALAAYIMIVERNVLIAALILFIALVLLMQRKVKYNACYKRVQKALTLEFPVWLRDISLSLNTLTVVNAFEQSLDSVSYPFRKELEKLLKELDEEPLSIKPYSSFLAKYSLTEAQSAMKVLYSIQNLGAKETKAQVGALILRNQEMLDKAENIKNQDAIGGVEALGFVPMIVFTVVMMVTMFMLFNHMVANLNNAVEW